MALSDTEDPRKTQFAGFAKLLFDRLYDQFNNLRYQEDDGTYQGRDKEAEQTRKDIIETIAEAGYDLVGHATRYHLCGDKYYKSSEEKINAIPDLTEWPDEASP